jgi:lipid-binding SYLF domain-containing protein
MKKLMIALTAFAISLSAAPSDAPARLQAAADVFKEVMGIPDKAIPQDLLNKSQCVIIVPGLKKGAFIVGAQYGKGFVSCRSKAGVGWGAPGSIRVEGGSVGFQAGGSETDVIMLVMNESGMRRLLTSKFTLGGDVTAAAGPVPGACSQALR